MSNTINVSRIISNSGDIVIDPAGYSEVVISRHPKTDYGAATKGYVDSRTSGLHVVQPCRLYANVLPNYSIHPVSFNITGNIYERLVIDDVQVFIGDRILFASESDARVEYGIYTVLNVGSNIEQWKLTRSADTNQTSELYIGIYTLITEGTCYSGSGFTLITKGLIVINETPLQYVMFSAQGKYSFNHTDNVINPLISSIHGNNVIFKGIKAGNGININTNADNNEINVNIQGINHSLLLIGNTDDHLNYFHIPGRIGGQTVYGGTMPGDNLFISSTSSISKGYVEIDNLRVSGTTEFVGGFQIANIVSTSLRTSNNGEFGGNCTINQMLHVSGNSTFVGTNNTFVGDIRTSGAFFGISALFSSQIESTNNSTGAVVISGGLAVAKSINANKVICENVIITGESTVSGIINSTRGIIAQELELFGQTATNTLGTGVLVLSGDNAGLSVGGNIYLGGSVNTENNVVCNVLFANTISSSNNLTINTHTLFSSANFANNISIDGNIIMGNCVINNAGITCSQFTINGNINIPNLRTNFVSVDTITTETLSINTTVINTSGKIISSNTLVDSICTAGGVIASKNITSLQKITTPLLCGENNLDILSNNVNINANLLNVSADSHFTNGIRINNGLISLDSSILGLLTISGNGITCSGNMNIYPSGILYINSSSTTFSGQINANIINAEMGIFTRITLNEVSGNDIKFIGETPVKFLSSIFIENTTDTINSTTGALMISGGVGIAKNIFVGQNCTIVGNLSATQISTSSLTVNLLNCPKIINSSGIEINKLNITDNSSSALIVSGGAKITGTLELNKLLINSDNIVSSTGSINCLSNFTTQNLSCDNLINDSITTNEITSTTINSTSANISNITTNVINSTNVIINSSVDITNTSSSNSNTTGALIIAGGLGVGENLHVSGNVFANAIYTSRINPVHGLFVAGAMACSDHISCNSMSTSVITTHSINSNSGTVTINSNFMTANSVNVKNLSVSEQFAMNGSMVVSGAGIFAEEIATTDLAATNATLHNIIAHNAQVNVSSLLTCHNGINATNITVNTVNVSGIITCETINSNKFTGFDGVLIENTDPGAEIILSSTSNASKGCIRITDTTNSSNLTSGALLVAGGVSIAKNLYIGDTLNVPNITINDSIITSNKIMSHESHGLVYHHGSSHINVRLKTSRPLNNATSDGNSITLVAAQNIDGIVPNVGDLILIDNGINNRHYGIYIITSETLYTRFHGCDDEHKMVRGMIIIITDGVEFGGSMWMHTTNSQVGTDYTFSDILTFSQISNAQGVISSGSKLGNGVNFFSAKNNSVLDFKGLKTNNTLLISENATDINLSVNVAGISHNSLDGNHFGDPHTQYPFSTGRLGGQSICGGINSLDLLTLSSPGGIILASPTTATSIIIPGIISIDNNITINNARENNQFTIRGSSDDNLLHISNNFIGIGTAVAEEKLHVIGNAKITGTVECNDISCRSVDTHAINCDSNMVITTTGEARLTKNPVSTYGIATKGYVDDLVSGNTYIYASSEPYTSTSSTTFIRKVRLVTGNIVAGSYRLGWNYSWSYSSNSRTTNVSLIYDDNVTINETIDTAPLGNLIHKKQTCGFATIDITNGSHTVDLLFKTSRKSDIITIGQARIELWRIRWA